MEPNQARCLSPYEFKQGHLESQAARNMNSTFGEGTANERTMRRLVCEIQVTPFKSLKRIEESLI